MMFINVWRNVLREVTDPRLCVSRVAVLESVMSIVQWTARESRVRVA